MDGTALVEPGSASAVMVPYASLLHQNLQNSLDKDVITFKYTVSSKPPPDFQVLYFQPESGKMTPFKR